jgi:hypothetical protein
MGPYTCPNSPVQHSPHQYASLRAASVKELGLPHPTAQPSFHREMRLV